MKIYIILKNGSLKIVENIEDDLVFQELDVDNNYDPQFVLERSEQLLELFINGQKHHLFNKCLREWACWDECKILQQIYPKLK